MTAPTSSAVAAAPEPSAPAEVVSADLLDVAGTGHQRAPRERTARARDNADAIRPATESMGLRRRPGLAAADPTTPAVLRPAAAATTSPAAPTEADQAAVPAGLSAYTITPVNPQGSIPHDLNIAVSGPRLLGASGDLIEAWRTNATESEYYWWLYDFFALPTNEYYWGAFVAWSSQQARFVAVMPSFQDHSAACAKGYLNVAVSTTSDPLKPWLRYRIAMTDAWADIVSVGVSDDKVVLAANEWDLDPNQGSCLGSDSKGARIRVVDWADLIDAGTLTVRDVSPTPRTDYYGWVAAANVPGVSSLAAGTTVHIVGERYVNETWGHLAYATVTGSAKTGTAALVGNVDLTTARSLPPLNGPPALIAAFGAGNGFQDERPISAAWRAGRLWLSTNETCRMASDTQDRACARYVKLDTTTTPPSIVENVVFGDVERDTFHPIVGFSRDGTAFFTMSASSATSRQPIDQYVAYRAAGQPVLGGADEVLVRKGDRLYENSNWGNVGSMVADPSATAVAWQAVPANTIASSSTGIASRLQGGLTGTPGGTFTINNGLQWYNQYLAELRITPASTSPILWVRYSASPVTEDTPGGPRLVLGVETPSGPSGRMFLSDPGVGGYVGEGSHSVFVQWRTDDGTWSTPVERSIGIDRTRPAISPTFHRFELNATVGSTAPVRTWAVGTDSLSGIGGYMVNRNGFNGAALTTAKPWISQALKIGSTYRYLVQAVDRAGNASDYDDWSPVTVRAYQGTSTSISYYRTWSSSTGTSYLGGSTRYATLAGAKATFTFSGRAAAIVSTRGPTRGKAEVWVDGIKVATIDLYSSTTKYRQIVWQGYWPSSAAHKVVLRVLGTSKRPRVDLDAFLKL